MVKFKLLLFLLFSIQIKHILADIEYGHCLLRGTKNDENVVGEVHFLADSTTSKVKVIAQIDGISVNVDKEHGMHIHAFGDMTSDDAMATGSHFIGNGSPDFHACENTTERHEGDMGNWFVNANGTISQDKELDLLQLTGGNSIIGRAVVLHANTDDCKTVPSSGSRLAQCVIGVGNPAAFNQTINTAYALGNNITKASCVLQDLNGSGVSGYVYIEQNENGTTTVIAEVFGLEEDSIHGFHIHQYGDLSSEDGLATGGHYNPTQVFHALPLSFTRHIGDMGNLNFYHNGTAYYRFVNEKIGLGVTELQEPFSVIGRAIIVHSGADDGCTQPTGNAGSRLAQCVIGVSPNAVPPTLPETCCGHQERSSCASSLPLDKLKLPEGFEISVFAADIAYAREMVMSPKGILFVGTMQLKHLNITSHTGVSNVYALIDNDGDFKADQVYAIAKDLSVPCGVEFMDGSLYLSLLDRILRFDNIEENLANPPEPVVITDKYPNDIWHGWKYIKFGPDGHLYVPVGANCNTCNVTGYFGTMTKINVSDPDAEPIIVARGLRNSVGFDWHPETGEMWFTDNGRDEWGNDRPPDELNVMKEEGKHFGFPYCYGKNYSDPQYNVNMSCAPYVPAQFELGPHVAAIGMRFYTGKMFPEKYQKDRIFIAEHGSWNRDIPLGYRITTVNVNDPNSYEVFIDGWLPSTTESGDSAEAWGRPTNVLVLADGSMLISDDKANAIYRVTYKAPQNSDAGKEKFASWKIALIVAGSVVGVAAIAIIAFFVIRNQRKVEYKPI